MISESDFPLNRVCVKLCLLCAELTIIYSISEHFWNIKIKWILFTMFFPSFCPFLFLWRNTAKFWVVKEKNNGEFPPSCHVHAASFRFCYFNVPRYFCNKPKKPSAKQFLRLSTHFLQHLWISTSCLWKPQLLLSTIKRKSSVWWVPAEEAPPSRFKWCMLNVACKKPQNCLWLNSLRVFFSVNETCF